MKKMKIQYIKLNNNSTEPYVLFSETMRLLKKRRNYSRSDSGLPIPNKHQSN